MVLDATPEGERLFPYTYADYHASIEGVSSFLGLSFSFTPHSPRAGFATESISAGRDPATVRSEGRWSSETSFKTYVDIVLASQVGIMLNLSGHQNAIIFVSRNLFRYFSPELLSSERHASKRINVGSALRGMGAARLHVSGRDEASRATPQLNTGPKQGSGGKGRQREHGSKPSASPGTGQRCPLPDGKTGKASGKGPGNSRLLLSRRK